MASLEDLMNAPTTTSNEDRAPNPTIKIEWEKKDTQVIRYRYLQDLNRMNVRVRHWDEDIKRYVECGQKPGFRDVKDKQGKKTGVKEPTLWGRHFNDQNELVPSCWYCEQKSILKKKIMDDVIARGETQMSKEEGILVGKCYKRAIEMEAPVEAEIKEGDKVVRELAGGVIRHTVYDLYFPQFKAQYKQLKSKFDNKGTLLNHWFVLNGEGTIDIDDKLTKEEKRDVGDIDLDYFARQTLSYDEGMKKREEKANAGDAATPQEDTPEEAPDLTEQDDDEIPFGV